MKRNGCLGRIGAYPLDDGKFQYVMFVRRYRIFELVYYEFIKLNNIEEPSSLYGLPIDNTTWVYAAKRWIRLYDNQLKQEILQDKI